MLEQQAGFRIMLVADQVSVTALSFASSTAGLVCKMPPKMIGDPLPLGDGGYDYIKSYSIIVSTIDESQAGAWVFEGEHGFRWIVATYFIPPELFELLGSPIAGNLDDRYPGGRVTNAIPVKKSLKVATVRCQDVMRG